MTEINRICLIGFGEVGQILAEDLAAAGVAALSAWDIKLPDPRSVPSHAVLNSRVREGEDAADRRVDEGGSGDLGGHGGADFAGGNRDGGRPQAGIVLPGQELGLSRNQGRGRGASRSGRGYYVEAAVMSPFPSKRCATPVLLGGPHAATLMPLVQELGFDGVTVFSDRLGQA